MGCTETRETTSAPTFKDWNESKTVRGSLGTPVHKLYIIYLSNLDDHSEQLGSSPYPSWANCPTTVACQAVSYLNKLKVLSDDKLITEYSDKLLKNIGKDRALDQHLMYFLYRNATCDHFQFINSLLKKDLFSKITPFVMDSNTQFRSLAIKLCCRLLRYSNISIQLFHESKLINYLIAQFTLKSTDKRITKASIKCLKFLLKSKTYGNIFASILVEKKSLLAKSIRSIKDQNMLEQIYIVCELVNNHI